MSEDYTFPVNPATEGIFCFLEPLFVVRCDSDLDGVPALLIDAFQTPRREKFACGVMIDLARAVPSNYRRRWCALPSAAQGQRKRPAPSAGLRRLDAACA
jgi:hypothetical protein